MTDNELLIALSNMMDEKLKPVNERLKKIEFNQENNILPRLQNIEACYTSTFNRYSTGIEELEALKKDVSILKKVVLEHSEKLKKIG